MRNSRPPLLLLLVAWIAYGFWRRRAQVREIQREIESLARQTE